MKNAIHMLVTLLLLSCSDNAPQQTADTNSGTPPAATTQTINNDVELMLEQMDTACAADKLESSESESGQPLTFAAYAEYFSGKKYQHTLV